MNDGGDRDGPRRRDVLRSVGALTLLAGFPGRALARERVPRLVVVILRGGLDGLAAVAPVGDSAYADARGELAAEQAYTPPLDGFFAFDRSLSRLHALYCAGEALIVHAAATPYRGRLHREAEAVLESGLRERGETGWLNRAAAALQMDAGLVAIGQSTPLILSGQVPALVATPAALRCAGAAGLARIAARHGGGSGSIRVAAVGALASDAPSRALEAAAAAAQLLADPEGARIAVMHCEGFDTHYDQVKRLPLRLEALDSALAVLAEGLAPVWRDSVVLVASEFGRSVGANAAGGTDHGVATAAFLLGGAVRGGRVLADWPGLARAGLEQGGLAPTTDLRAIVKGVLRDHLGLAESVLATSVFPDSAGVRPLGGLIGLGAYPAVLRSLGVGVPVTRAEGSSLSQR